MPFNMKYEIIHVLSQGRKTMRNLMKVCHIGQVFDAYVFNKELRVCWEQNSLYQT